MRLNLQHYMDVIFITDKDAQRLDKYLVKENDIVYSRRGDVEKCAFIRKKQDGWLCGTGCLRVRIISDDLDAKFCAYYLSTDEIKAWVSSNAVGTTMPNLNSSILKKLPLIVPTLPEQKAIAAVLSSLDDKIDLLHRQNQTLEAMAQTLFRQWFIEEAREDWKDVMLGDYFPVVTGKKDANFSTDDGLYPFFTCSQTYLKAPNFSFDASAILLAGNGDFNVKRYVGKFEAYQRTYVLIPHETKYFNFLFTLIRFYLDEITEGSQGSVISFITKGMITDFKFKMPLELTDNQLVQFDCIYNKIDKNQKQIQTLTQLRDTLLPKLMSGEIRVEVEYE